MTGSARRRFNLVRFAPTQTSATTFFDGRANRDDCPVRPPDTAPSTRWGGGSPTGDWLVGERLSIADVSLYAYTHVAHEGGFDLESYPAVRAWLSRVAGQPGHIPIDA